MAKARIQTTETDTTFSNTGVCPSFRNGSSDTNAIHTTYANTQYSTK